MWYRRLLSIFALAILLSIPGHGQSPVIVRDSLGLLGLRSTCLLLGCTVNQQLDGSVGAVFLITSPPGIPLQTFLTALLGNLGIVDAEPDQLLHVMQSQTWPTPSGLYDTTPVTYYGTTVWEGYVQQRAVSIINLPEVQARQTFNPTGSGIVAVIDTGVDPNQPVLQGVLLQGYDFTRNQSGGSERGDVNQSTMSVVDGAAPVQVNQTTMAVVDQQGSDTFSQ